MALKSSPVKIHDKNGRSKDNAQIWVFYASQSVTTDSGRFSGSNALELRLPQSRVETDQRVFVVNYYGLLLPGLWTRVEILRERG